MAMSARRSNLVGADALPLGDRVADRGRDVELEAVDGERLVESMDKRGRGAGGGIA